MDLLHTLEHDVEAALRDAQAGLAVERVAVVRWYLEGQVQALTTVLARIRQLAHHPHRPEYVT
jgi:hypothetical protein